MVRQDGRFAQSAMDAATDQRVHFPDRYAKGYLDWGSAKKRLARQSATVVGVHQILGLVPDR